ncbi:MAG: type II toxin-antitoxin system HicB family antitoxin [Bacteroidales bacterium]
MLDWQLYLVTFEIQPEKIQAMRFLEYKGYKGTIEYSKKDDLLYGKVLGIQGLISYEGSSGKDLEEDFIAAIDEYLSDCKQRHITPEKPFKGSFNVRISPELHQKAALLAMEDQISLNSFVAESIRQRIKRETGI